MAAILPTVAQGGIIRLSLRFMGGCKLKATQDELGVPLEQGGFKPPLPNTKTSMKKTTMLCEISVPPNTECDGSKVDAKVDYLRAKWAAI